MPNKSGFSRTLPRKDTVSLCGLVARISAYAQQIRLPKNTAKKKVVLRYGLVTRITGYTQQIRLSTNTTTKESSIIVWSSGWGIWLSPRNPRFNSYCGNKFHTESSGIDSGNIDCSSASTMILIGTGCSWRDQRSWCKSSRHSKNLLLSCCAKLPTWDKTVRKQ